MPTRTHPTTEEEQDLALAAELQAALLPKGCPRDCPHQRIAARNRMCRNVGGDFYDFIHINDEQIALVIGDVVGHGVRAALLMAKIMGYLRSEPRNRSQPVKVLSALNTMLLEVGENTGSILTCSMFYAVIDLPSGVSLFVNAGHTQPFLCDKNACATLPLEPRNMLLGIEDFKPDEGCLTFFPGQRLVMYTDGITEALNAEKKQFGSRRLHELVGQYAEADADVLAQAVFDAVDQFRQGAEQSDDQTIVVVDRL